MLTAEELAEELKVGVAAIRAWQRRGVPYIPVGRLRRYDLSAVLNWLQERENIRPAKKEERKELRDAN